MKKYLVGILMLITLLMPSVVGALELSDYETKGLKETLDEEQIEYDFKKYSENEKQIPIYMFRGNGCGFCRNFLTFLNSITDEYGKYFKLVSFEVWQNEQNSELLNKIGAFLGDDVGGVPYIVIGDKTFTGYSEVYDEDIKKAIMNLYESDDRYDVFEEYVEPEEANTLKEEGKAETDNTTVIICTIITNALVAIGLVTMFIYNKKRFDKLEALHNTKKKKD